MSLLYIDASPKKHWSNSAYFMGFSKLFTGGSKYKLPRAGNCNNLLNAIDKVDQVVLAMPLYVDGIPSHVLRFLQIWETHMQKSKHKPKLYIISNCGFYEGSQTHHLMRQMEIWCKQSGVSFMGGIGIGAGEMLGILRLTPLIRVGISLIMITVIATKELINNAFSILDIIEGFGLMSILISLGVSVLFSVGAAFHLFRLAIDIKRNRAHKVRYTTVWFCPRFLFYIFAAIYWCLRMMIMHRVMPWQAFKKAELPLVPRK